MTTLYNISNLTTDGNTFTAAITLNPSHSVFAGHFPGQPVVPGVVLVEIATAVVSRLLKMEMIVTEASVIKFLQVIDPTVNPVLLIDGSIVEEEENKFKATCRFSSGEVEFAKLRGIKLIKC